MSEQETVKSIAVKASEVLEQAFGLEGKLPDEETLGELLRTRKFAPLRVDVTEQTDFLSDDMEAFLKFVRVNSIKSVLYSYRYYTEKDLDQEFRLSDAEKKFFSKHMAEPEIICDENGQPMYPDSVPTGPYEESDFVYYLNYIKYVKLALDLTMPRELWLYAVHQGRTVACHLTAEWLTRLNLPNAQLVKETCVNFRNYSGYREGGIQFIFEYDVYSGDDEAEAQTDAEADAPAEPSAE